MCCKLTVAELAAGEGVERGGGSWVGACTCTCVGKIEGVHKRNDVHVPNEMCPAL